MLHSIPIAPARVYLAVRRTNILPGGHSSAVANLLGYCIPNCLPTATGRCSLFLSPSNDIAGPSAFTAQSLEQSELASSDPRLSSALLSVLLSESIADPRPQAVPPSRHWYDRRVPLPSVW